jgi:hypothetical protein
MDIVLHEEAFDELREAFIEAGALLDDAEMRSAKSFSVQDITYKLWEYVPTAEQLARWAAFAETPYGKAMKEIFLRSNEAVSRMMADWEESNIFMDGTQWDGKIGSALRINLPTDFPVRAD